MSKHRGLVCVLACGKMAMGFIAALLLFAGTPLAEDKEPSAVVEIGGVGEWGLGGGFSFGPAVAIEVTPIKNWLEIEAGVAPLFGGGHADWGTDLLFKKPFELSNTVEFEPGIGPEWSSGGKIAGQVAFDFMIWPSPERKFGWFLEPSYSYSFSKDHEQSLGVSIGPLIAIP